MADGKNLKYSEFKNFRNLGANMQCIMGGFGSFTLLASKLLLAEKVGTPDENSIAQFEPTAWYPLDSILRVMDRIQADFGDFTLRQVGIYVPKVAPLPPQVVDIISSFESLDIGYHLVHGYTVLGADGVTVVDTEPLFNPATGEMKEGIGHYKYNYDKAKNRITIESTGIYQCAFDEGMMTALAQRFKPKAVITHDKGSCRKRGGSHCVYQIVWQ